MAFNLRNFLEEKIADVNPFDGGKTAATVRAQRQKPAPAQTIRRQPVQSGRLGQMNQMLDNGASFESISQKTGLDVNRIRNYVDGTRPGYGIKATPKPRLFQQVADTVTEFATKGKDGKNFVDNVGDMTLGNTARLINTANSGVVQPIVGMARGKGAAEIQRDMDKNLYSDRGGLLNTGTLFPSKQQYQQTFKDPQSFAKGFTGAGVGVATEVVPVMRGASLVTKPGLTAAQKVIRGAGEGALYGGAGTAAQQQLYNGELDAKGVLEGAALGMAMGGAVPAAAAGVQKVTPVAKQGVQKTAQAARTANTKLEQSNPRVREIDQTRVQMQRAFDVETDPMRRKQISQGLAQLNQERLMLTQGGYIGGPKALGFEQAQKDGLVFEGVDGKPRFEVDDSGAKIKLFKPERYPGTDITYSKVGDILDHPRLYEQYPHLKDIDVAFKKDPNVQGAYHDDIRGIELSEGLRNNPEGLRSTLLHELQHGIQNKEGFARGGAARGDANYIAAQENKSRVAKGKRPLSTHDTYRHLAGEAEARAVQARRNMPMSERYVKPETSSKFVGGNVPDKQTRAFAMLDGDMEAAGYSNHHGVWVDNAFDADFVNRLTPENIATLKAQGITHIEKAPTKTGIEYGNTKVGDNNYGVIKVSNEGQFKHTTSLDFQFYHESGHHVWSQKMTPEDKAAFSRLNPEKSSTHKAHEHAGRVGGEMDSESFSDYLAMELQGKGDQIPAEVRPIVQKYATKPDVRSTFYDSLDVPKEDLIIRNGDGKATSLGQGSGSTLTPADIAHGIEHPEDIVTANARYIAKKSGDTSPETLDRIQNELRRELEEGSGPLVDKELVEVYRVVKERIANAKTPPDRVAYGTPRGGAREETLLKMAEDAPRINAALENGKKTKFDVGEIPAFGNGKSEASKKHFARFEEATKKYLGGLKSADIDRQGVMANLNKRFNLSDEEMLDAIAAIDNSTLKVPNQKVQDYVDAFRSLTDEAYVKYTDSGVRMGHVKDYLPRIYKHPETGEAISGEDYRILTTGSARQRSRTNSSLDVDALVEKDPTKLLGRYYRSMDSAVAGRLYLDDLESSGLLIRSNTPIRGLRPVIAEGLQDPDGLVFYGRKNVVDKLNRLFSEQSPSNTVEKTLDLLAKVNSFAQSVVLSGGVPNTPINAFGLMQAMKETMTGHPIKAAKAFEMGLSKSSAEKFFSSKRDILKLMAENDVGSSVDLEQIAKNGRARIVDASKKGTHKALEKAWDEFTNDATFGRLMPALELMHFETIYNKALKSMPGPEAAKVAAKSVQNFYGKTSDFKLAIRSRAAQDAAGAFLFAPRFRESMVNFWINNVKTLKNPLALESRDNMKFLAAAALTYAAMDALNTAFTGKHLNENPDGKEDKLLVPAEKVKQLSGGLMDTNGKDIGIPFLPSIATVPRNVAQLGSNLVKGNTEEAMKNIGSFASMPVKTVSEILSNQDYFGAPIVERDANPLQQWTGRASHVIKSNMQPWLREGLNAAGQGLDKETKKYLGIKDKSATEAISNTLELPLRFYNPNYYRYGGKAGTAADGSNSSLFGGLFTTNTSSSKKTGPDAIEALKDAKSERTDKLKASLSDEDYELMQLSKADRQKLVKDGVYTANKIKGLENYYNNKRKELGYSSKTKTTERPQDLTQASSAILSKYDSLDKKSRDTWLTKPNSDKAVRDQLQKWLGDKKLPDVITNEVAKELADYEVKYREGKISKLTANDEKGTILRKAFNSQLSKDEREIYKLTKDEIVMHLDKGNLKDENVEKALTVEKQLFDAGLISKEALARKLGLDARGYKTSSRSGGRKSSGKTSRSGSSRSSKKAAPKFDYKLFGFGSDSTSNSKQLYDLLKTAKMKANKA